MCHTYYAYLTNITYNSTYIQQHYEYNGAIQNLIIQLVGGKHRK